MAKKHPRKASRRRKKALNQVNGLRADPADVSDVVTTQNIPPANSNATLSGTGAFQPSAFQRSAFQTGEIAPSASSGRVTFQDEVMTHPLK
jgi:hypothetical protein